MCRTANMSWRTCVVVKQTQFHSIPVQVLYPRSMGTAQNDAPECHTCSRGGGTPLNDDPFSPQWKHFRRRNSLPSWLGFLLLLFLALAAEGEAIEAETDSARCAVLVAGTWLSWCLCPNEASVRHGCTDCAGALVQEGTCCHVPGLTGGAGEGVLRGTGTRGTEILPEA